MRQMVAYAVVQAAPKAKVIVLDADNTLWGGIVGEDGLSRYRPRPGIPRLGACQVPATTAGPAAARLPPHDVQQEQPS